MNENRLRERICEHAVSLFSRGFTPGSSGNISVRLDDGILVTPTNSCLGRLDPARLSRLDAEGQLVSGDPPSKEAVLHQAVYRARPSAMAIVHLHSPHSVAVSCLADVNPDDALPPITAYYVMRVGQLPLLPYYLPGDAELAAAVGRVAAHHRAVLLSNHGPVVAGKSLDSAVYSAEELEETAKLYLMLRRGQDDIRCLTEAQVAELRARFPG